MHRKPCVTLAAYLLASMLTLTTSACQGENSDYGEEGETGGPAGPSADDPCGACAPNQYAVDCGYLWGLGEFTMCGINQDNAEYLCESTWGGVVKSSPSDDCVLPSEPWDPTLDVRADPAGSYTAIIDSALLDRLEESPRDIYLDATRVDWNDVGEVFISTPGELSIALGLQQGDVLVDINRYAFTELLDTARLYSTLRDARSLSLTIERRGVRMTLAYYIE